MPPCISSVELEYFFSKKNLPTLTAVLNCAYSSLASILAFPFRRFEHSTSRVSPSPDNQSKIFRTENTSRV